MQNSGHLSSSAGARTSLGPIKLTQFNCKLKLELSLAIREKIIATLARLELELGLAKADQSIILQPPYML
jgi:hypothetical protein